MPPRNRRPKAIQTHANAQRVDRDAQNDVHSNGPVAGCRDSRTNAAPHPIHSLPLEILTQIFILTLHIDFAAVAKLHDASRHGQRRLRIFNPLVLCAVCSSWRSLAFAIPRLWQRVLIHIPVNLKKAQTETEKRAANLIQWIERARSLPLALHMSYDGYLDGTTPEAPFLSVVNDYATRWESLYLQDRHTALQLGPSPTLPLTLFQLDKCHACLWKLTRLCPHHPPIDDIFPWAELTHLQLHGCGTPCETIFMKAPNLVQLSMSVTSLCRCITMGASMILHNLVTFSFKMNPRSSDLLNRLSLPSLRDMFIKQVSSEHIHPLLNFFTRSSCSLDKLEVHGQNLSPDDLLNVLAHRSCNSLTSLKILEPSSWQRKGELVNDAVLRRLTLCQDNSLCPHLKFLTIDCATECSLSALLKIVESRVGCLTDWQLPDEQIQYLHLRSIKHLSDVRELDKVGKRSGMECTRRRYREAQGHSDRGRYFYSVLSQKQGLQRRQLLVNHGGFFFDLD